MKIVAYVPDLMDRSRFSGLSCDVEFVSSPLALTGVQSDAIVVDLSRPQAFDLAISGALADRRVIAFVSHVDKEKIALAKAAGVTEVLPRSRFFSRIVEILQ